MTNICVIPARGGSRRIPRKNIKLFHGKPIIAYSIETAKASGLFTDVWVSTEDDEIGRIAEGYGAKWYKRAETLTDDYIGTQEVARDFIQWMHDQDEPYKYVCCIYPTAPMLSYLDLKRGLHELKRDDIWFSFGVGTNPLRDAGQFYWSKSVMLKNKAHLYGTHTALIAIDESRVCDINTELDWFIADQMYDELQDVV